MTMWTAASGKIHVSIAAILPVVLLGAAFQVYCLVDIARHPVRHLPKWAWILIVLASVPAGGIVYLVVGRDPR